MIEHSGTLTDLNNDLGTMTIQFANPGLNLLEFTPEVRIDPPQVSDTIIVEFENVGSDSASS